MKQLLVIILVILVLAGVAFGIWLAVGEHNDAGGAAETAAPYQVPELTKTYRNETYRFSLQVPQGFTATEVPDEESASIVIQSGAGEGIQITVSPHADVRTLTAGDVQLSDPAMQVLNPEVVEIGDEYRGIAFKSDNPFFGGESREVWFVFHGTLYRISTYARFDSLLQAMFSTWEFF